MKFHHIAAVATGVAAARLAGHHRSLAGSAAIQRSAITFAGRQRRPAGQAGGCQPGRGNVGLLGRRSRSGAGGRRRG